MDNTTFQGFFYDEEFIYDTGFLFQVMQLSLISIIRYNVWTSLSLFIYKA